MKMVTYGFKILQSVWRRKSTILLVASIIGILIFCITEYNHRRRSPSISSLNNYLLSQQKLKKTNAQKTDAINVKFIEKINNDDNILAIEHIKQQINTESEYIRSPIVQKSLPYIPKKRLVHFDLKGAPPRLSYFKRIFPLLKSMGATGLLMEYEDMFPFTGTLEQIAAGNAYTRDEIFEIQQAAKENNLEIIPLIQTFGHVEFILKHEQFIPLREIADSPQALCPSRNQSLILIRELITQIMNLHSDIQYLHIGCDEVFQMGECEKCREIVRETLFLQHIKNVVSIVKEKWPHIKIIIWDDMLRHIPERQLDEMKIGEMVQPMVWVYVEQIYHFVQTQVWEKYAAIFPSVWAASAYKGAFGETLYIPNAKRHLANNLRWLELMDEQTKNFKNGFEGIVLTGWQRYDHFAILCELLPSALPSLALNLIAVTNGYFNETLKGLLISALNCPQYQTSSTSSSGSGQFLALDTDPYLWDRFSRCMFPGSPFFKLTYRLDAAETEVNDYIKSVKQFKGWMTDYNVKYNYSLPLRVDELMSEFPRVYHTMTSLVRSANDAMTDIYDLYTIGEWIDQRILPLIHTLDTIQSESNRLKQHKVWPRRPLKPTKELEKYGIPIQTII